MMFDNEALKHVCIFWCSRNPKQIQDVMKSFDIFHILLASTHVTRPQRQTDEACHAWCKTRHVCVVTILRWLFVQTCLEETLAQLSMSLRPRHISSELIRHLDIDLSSFANFNNRVAYRILCQTSRWKETMNKVWVKSRWEWCHLSDCLLYTSDAADE